MDWIAAALNLIGLWLLADHRRKAMYIFIASSLAFLIWSVSEQVWSIAALQFVLIILNIRVVIKWRKNGQIRQPTKRTGVRTKRTDGGC